MLGGLPQYNGTSIKQASVPVATQYYYFHQMSVKIAGPVPPVPVTEFFRFLVTVIFCIQGMEGLFDAEVIFYLV